MANEQYITNLTDLPEGAEVIQRQPATPQQPPVPSNYDRYRSGVLPQVYGGTQVGLENSQSANVAPVYRIQLSPLAGTAGFNAGVKSTTAPQIAAAIAAIPPSTGGGSGGGLTNVILTGPPSFIQNTQSTTGTVETIAQTLEAQTPGLVFQSPPPGLTSFSGAPTSGAANGPVSITFTPKISSGWFLYFSRISGASTTTPTGWTGHGNSGVLSFSSNASVTATEPGTSGSTTNWCNTVLVFSTALPSFVQFNSGALSSFNGLGIPTNVAYSSNNTAGNTLVVVLKGQAAAGGGLAAMSFFDSNGNSYSLLSSSTNGSTTGFNVPVSLNVYVATNCVGGANTITAIASGAFSGGAAYSVELYEFGPLAAGPSVPNFSPISPSEIPPLNASVIASGQIGLAQGGTASDLHATGGTSQYLAQLTSGAAITVQQPNFTDLAGTISGAQLAASIVKTGQTGSISAATLVPSPVTTALYQVNYYMNVTTAGTSGTVQATFTWNDGAAQTLNSSTITFGTLGSFVSGTFLIKATSGTPQYSTTVTSALGSPVYSLDIRVVPLG